MSEVTIIDVSYWQRHDWMNYEVLAGQIDGVILRAAYGTAKDTRLDLHYQGFTRAGVPVGVYHYIIGNYPGSLQAETLKRAIDGKELKLGVWVDVEDRREGTRLTRNVTLDYVTAAEKFTQRPLGVYTGGYAWDELIGTPLLSNRLLWIANYGVSKPYLPRTGGWSNWHLWQHTDKGRLPGYPSSLDLNRFNGTRQDYERWINQEQTHPGQPETGTLETWALELDAWARSSGYTGIKPPQ